MMRVVFTAIIMSTASFRAIAGAPIAWGESILLFASEGFLMGPGNSATTILPCADPRPAVIVPTRRLTVYHVSTVEPGVPATTNAVILCMVQARRGFNFAGSRVGVR